MRLRHLPHEVAVILDRRRADASPDAAADAAADARAHAGTDGTANAGPDGTANACSHADARPDAATHRRAARTDCHAAAPCDGPARTCRDGIRNASRDGRSVIAGGDRERCGTDREPERRASGSVAHTGRIATDRCEPDAVAAPGDRVRRR